MKLKKKAMFLVVLALMLSIMSRGVIKVSAAGKYYSPSSLGITNESCYKIKSLKGNTLTYYKWKVKTKTYHYKGTTYTEDVSVRTGAYKKAKITPKTKYYIADASKFSWANQANGSKQKYIRKVSKKEFFKAGPYALCTYTCKSTAHNTYITVKNGKITRIVQIHIAG